MERGFASEAAGHRKAIWGEICGGYTEFFLHVILSFFFNLPLKLSTNLHDFLMFCRVVITPGPAGGCPWEPPMLPVPHTGVAGSFTHYIRSSVPVRVFGAGFHGHHVGDEVPEMQRG